LTVPNAYRGLRFAASDGVVRQNSSRGVDPVSTAVFAGALQIAADSSETATRSRSTSAAADRCSASTTMSTRLVAAHTRM